ncbi:hypothetical protein QBC36DRAFT_292500 [Triangularia setosa]|uniref:Clr5 domain-containing protein n=1 Tax=Triangularia setosa TaxID=2587417 RepID=A0AAN6W528_9PEZI|nr:hypothetical protein QBC36DRAFT_292500 [Podospora setosa]
MPRADPFMPEQKQAKRIPESHWERYKDIIIAKYKELTLDEVREYMEREHNFKASRRQYVHRLGSTKWNIAKYKGNQPPGPNTPQPGSTSPQPSPVSPGLSSVRNLSPSGKHPVFDFSRHSYEKLAAYHNLSECLLYLGDLGYAFAIKAELYRVVTTILGDFAYQKKQQLLRRYVIDCIRIIQTEATAKAARQMLEKNSLLYEDWAKTDDNTWESVLFRILVSRTYDLENSESSIIQIVEIINKTTVEEDETGQEKLQTLGPRGYRFDLLMYKIFSYALERYNEPTAMDEIPIDVRELLKQFKNTQPAVKDRKVDPRLEWELVLKILDFCVSELSNSSFVPLRLDNKSTRANRIFCTLWYALQKRASTLENIVNDKAYTQFATSSTEILSIVVGLIVDEAPSLTLPLKEWAVAGAHAVKRLEKERDLDQEDTGLINRFLDKANSINVEIMLEDHERKLSDVAAIEQLNILRKEAAQEIGITDLPDLELGAALTEPLTANWDLSWNTPQQRPPWSQGLHVNTAQRRARSRSSSQSHSPSATSSSQSQSPATNGNTNGQASYASASGDNEDRIHLD